jgi:agmatinase
MRAALQPQASALISRHHMVWLGGDHSITLPLLRAGIPVYLSLDIDCLDPAFAPGTGTPEPGGLATVQVMTLLEELHGLPWIGMDLCEVALAYDQAELTSNAAATLVWTYLCGRIAASART